ncbi:Shikimate O-hydroxycinnamoyltransferase [Linum perenne]
MKVTVKETTLVRPADDGPTERMWLCNMDLIHPKTHVRTIYVYKEQTTTSFSSSFFDTKVLKDALSRALVSFYPMAGRLVNGDGNGGGRLELECNGDGVLFQEAEADVSIDELGEFLPSSGSEDRLLNQLVPWVDYSKGVSSYSLCLLQVTRFKCGGICLGLGINHTVADGQSALNFINTWSTISRCGPNPESTVTPFLDRTILQARNPPTPKFHHTEYNPHPTMIDNTTTPKGPPTVEILNIKPELIDLLKEKTMPTKNNSNHHESSTILKYSSYEVLAAHIWRCATKARDLNHQQPTSLVISVDGRSRLNPPVPRGYFGNVIFHTTPTALAGELVSEPMSLTVERIRQAIARMDDEYLRSAIDYLEDPNSKVTPPGSAPTPNVKLVSWIRLPFKSTADFGWGAPVLTRQVNFAEGKGHILPRNDDGSLSLAICLEADVMVEFKRMLCDV